jgi:large subunit ribosomal protein L4e
MKLKIFNTAGTQAGEAELPIQFNEPVREDLIKKAVLAIQNNRRQAYGPDHEAGQKHAVRISKRRRDYKASYGKGISRVPRKTMSHRGSQFFWQGANAPGMRGGRKAHPPKIEKIWSWKINDKEKRKAIRSAISATIIRERVLARGHLVPQNYPFIVNDDLENINKTQKLIEALGKLGFADDLNRASEPRVRAGKGRQRGRRNVFKKSLLLVVQDAGEVAKAAKNIPGVDVIIARKLNAEALAPGGCPGRAALFTTKAVDELKKGFFTGKKIAPEAKKEATKETKPAKAAKPKDAKR